MQIVVTKRREIDPNDLAYNTLVIDKKSGEELTRRLAI
jgi:hypothetical protein